MFVQDISSRVDGQNLAARRAKTRGTTQTFDGFIRNQENDSFSTWVISHERQGNSFRLGLKIRKVKLMQFVDCPVQLFQTFEHWDALASISQLVGREENL